MKLRRTMLFMPGNNPHMLLNADIYKADSVVFDLEDAVSVNEKDSYMLFLSYDKENDTYFILCDAYGACKMDKGLIYSLAEEKYVDAEFK